MVFFCENELSAFWKLVAVVVVESHSVYIHVNVRENKKRRGYFSLQILHSYLLCALLGPFSASFGYQ